MQMIQVAFGDALDCRFRGQALQGAADVKRLFDILNFQRRDVSSASGMNLNQAFGGQLLDRMANWSRANTKLLSDFRNLKTFSWIEEVS